MEEKKKTLNLVKNSTSYKINIPANVEAKIRHLCSIIHDVEWSGILFYTFKGSFETNDFEVTCVDICVMDIGSGGYTEFIDSPDIVTYRIDNDLLGDIHEGLIHSHNTMNTFFSSTDLSTLTKEGTTSNHFVSLIVNNAGNYTAAVTRKVITETKEKIKIKSKTDKYYNTFDDKKVILEANKSNTEEFENNVNTVLIEYFNLDINKEENNPFKSIDTRLEELRKNKKSNMSFGSNFNSSFIGNFNYNGDWRRKLTGDYTSQSQYVKYPSKYQVKETDKPKQLNIFEDDEELEELPLCAVETFDENIIEDIAAKLLTGNIFATKGLNINTFIYNIDTQFEKYFGDFTSSKESEERLGEYLTTMLEFLLCTPDKALEERAEIVDYPFTIGDSMEVCAVCLCSYLETLPKSYVVNKVIDILKENYIPEDLY